MALLPLTALAFCLVISTGGSQGFTVEPAQSDLYVRIGGDAELTVRPSSAISSGTWDYKSKTIVTWIGTSPLILTDYRSRVNLNFTSGSLVLKSVNESDNGDYTVTVNVVGGGAQASATITLHALEPVGLVTLRTNEPKPVEDFDTVLLTCSARGTQLKREWLLNHHPVLENERLSISGDTLLIDPVERTDTGMYKCIVSNGLNSESAEKYVTVYLLALPSEVGCGFSPVAIAGIFLGLLAASLIGALCAWLVAKKTSGPKPAPRTNNDPDRTFGGDNTLAANAGDGSNPYGNLQGNEQGRSSNVPDGDPTYMGLKLEDRLVYSEIHR